MWNKKITLVAWSSKLDYPVSAYRIPCLSVFVYGPEKNKTKYSSRSLSSKRMSWLFLVFTWTHPMKFSCQGQVAETHPWPVYSGTPDLPPAGHPSQPSHPPPEPWRRSSLSPPSSIREINASNYCHQEKNITLVSQKKEYHTLLVHWINNQYNSPTQGEMSFLNCIVEK